jgi:hypothetical protein
VDDSYEKEWKHRDYNHRKDNIRDSMDIPIVSEHNRYISELPPKEHSKQKESHVEYLQCDSFKWFCNILEHITVD